MVGESEELRPSDQIGCGQDDFQPDGVGAEGVARQVSQPGGLQLADAVLDASVLAVSQLQAGDLTGDDTGSTFAYLHPEAQNTAGNPG